MSIRGEQFFPEAVPPRGVYRILDCKGELVQAYVLILETKFVLQPGDWVLYDAAGDPCDFVCYENFQKNYEVVE